ncbi:MAG: hypothetical protein J6U93_02940 [Alistipes sp.]|nr:hypothetical protein [Alistipes sp.]
MTFSEQCHMRHQERDKFAEWKGEIAQRCGNGVRRGSLLTRASLDWHVTTKWSTLPRHATTQPYKNKKKDNLSIILLGGA